MKHGLLYGFYEISIDAKNRLLVPADIRQSIDHTRDGDGFFAIIGHNNKIWLYPDIYYESLVTREEPQLLPSDESLEFDHLNFSLAHRLRMDGQYRVLLPDRLLQETQTGKAVTVFGSRDHAEIWNRDEFNVHFAKLNQRRREIADQKRLEFKAQAAQSRGI